MAILNFLGLIGLLLGIIGLVRGSVPRVRIANRKIAGVVLVIGLAFLLVGGPTQESSPAQEEPEEAERDPGEGVGESEDPGEEIEEEEEPEEDKIEEEARDVKLAFDLKQEEEALILQGNTNLPDEARILWEVEHLDEPEYGDDGDVTVDDEGFEVILDVGEWSAGRIEARAVFDTDVVEQSPEAAEYEHAEEVQGLLYTPAPVVYEGSGNDYFAVKPPGDPFMLQISGNAAARHFAVTGYDADGTRTELFVNTTDPYSGTTLDLERTRKLEIDAEGEWEVELRSVWDATVLEIPGEMEGTGDYVFLLGDEPSAADISGNEESSHFAVHGIGQRQHLLVNTTDEYEGRERVPGDVRILQVTAVGDWEMSIE